MQLLEGEGAGRDNEGREGKKSIRKYYVYKLDGRKYTSHFLPAV